MRTRPRLSFRAAWVLVAAPALACAPDLRDDHPFDGQVNSGPLVSVEAQGDGVLLATVDASNKGSQVFMDLDSGTEMKAEEAFSTNGWDLAFKRFEISMNGGAGNPTGIVRVAVVGDAFESLTRAPADGYLQDGADAVFASVEGGWYLYDLGAHKLVAREGLVYVVQTSQKASLKLQMRGYYGDDGTPAIIRFLYAPLLAP